MWAKIMVLISIAKMVYKVIVRGRKIAKEFIEFSRELEDVHDKMSEIMESGRVPTPEEFQELWREILELRMEVIDLIDAFFSE